MATGEKTRDAVKAVANSYEAGITDEFIKPIVVTDEKQNPVATIQEGDVVLCFNSVQTGEGITLALTQQDFPRTRNEGAETSLHNADQLRQFIP